MKVKATGIAKQSDLFTDTIGHPRDHVKAVATYCHYAVIHGRSPAGIAKGRHPGQRLGFQTGSLFDWMVNLQLDHDDLVGASPNWGVAEQRQWRISQRPG